MLIPEAKSCFNDGNILVISHKTTIRIALRSLFGINLGLNRYRIDVSAASVSVIKFGDHGLELETLGDRNYMPPHLRERRGT